MGQRQHAGDVQKKAKVFEADSFKEFIDRSTRLPPITPRRQVRVPGHYGHGRRSASGFEASH
jgi:hypothetical protein